VYFRKKLEDIPEENTSIWTCEKEGCNGWMRDNFAFECAPTCHVCHSPMVSSVKMLPLLVNTNSDLKSLKKGTRI
jgi:hypothetical protein